MSAPLTDTEYVAKNGMICPFCKSTNIEAGKPDCDTTYILVAVLCADCRREWDDVFQLVGYNTVEENN